MLSKVISGRRHSTKRSLAPWQVMFVTLGGLGASVSVMTTSLSEAGPSRRLVKALMMNLYLVKGAKNMLGHYSGLMCLTYFF